MANYLEYIFNERTFYILDEMRYDEARNSFKAVRIAQTQQRCFKDLSCLLHKKSLKIHFTDLILIIKTEISTMKKIICV